MLHSLPMMVVGTEKKVGLAQMWEGPQQVDQVLDLRLEVCGDPEQVVGPTPAESWSEVEAGLEMKVECLLPNAGLKRLHAHPKWEVQGKQRKDWTLDMCCQT